jgi:hypothetical protein
MIGDSARLEQRNRRAIVTRGNYHVGSEGPAGVEDRKKVLDLGLVLDVGPDEHATQHAIIRGGRNRPSAQVQGTATGRMVHA